MEVPEEDAAPASDRTPGLAADPAPANESGGALVWLLVAAVLAAMAGGWWYMRRRRNNPGLVSQGNTDPGQPG